MKIEHLAIWTDNLERLKSFYETYFNATTGSKYTNPTKGFDSFFLSFASGCRLEIMKSQNTVKQNNPPEKNIIGLAHFAVSVGSKKNVDDLTDHIKRNGYTIISGPRLTGDGYYESVIQDPDGNLIEITE